MSFYLKFVCLAVLIIGIFADSYFFTDYVSTTSSSACYCTTVPCPVEGANKLTVGSGSIGTYIYKLTSNNIPVVSSASVTLLPSDLDHGSDTTTCTQNYARSLDDDGVQDCDAGHILAHRLGGPGNQPINIFPQDLSVNRGSYAQFENSIYDCMSSGATSGALTWSFKYENDAHTKPNGVIYSATFNGGACRYLTQDFTN